MSSLTSPSSSTNDTTSNKLLSRLWYSTQNPGGFAGINQLYKSTRNETGEDEDVNIMLMDIKQFLKKQLPYQLHRVPKKKKFGDRLSQTPFYKVSKPGLQLGMDTMYLPKTFSPFRFTQVCMDLFSCYVWVYPSRILNAKIAANALKMVLEEQPTFDTVLTDAGTEYAADFDRYCQSQNMEHIRTNPVSQKHHVSPVERVIRTLKLRMGRILTSEKTKDAGKAIRMATDSYNKTYHRSIGMAPSSVSKRNASRIIEKKMNETFEKMDKAYGKHKDKLFDTKYKVGDLVHKLVISPKGHFQKESEQHFSQEVYRITDTDYGDGGEHLPMYRLSSLDGLELPGYYVQSMLIKAEENWHENCMLNRIKRQPPTDDEGDNNKFQVTFKGYPEELEETLTAPELEFYRKPYVERFGYGFGSSKF